MMSCFPDAARVSRGLQRAIGKQNNAARAVEWCFQRRISAFLLVFII